MSSIPRQDTQRPKATASRSTEIATSQDPSDNEKESFVALSAYRFFGFAALILATLAYFCLFHSGARPAVEAIGFVSTWLAMTALTIAWLSKVDELGFGILVLLLSFVPFVIGTVWNGSTMRSLENLQVGLKPFVDLNLVQPQSDSESLPSDDPKDPERPPSKTADQLTREEFRHAFSKCGPHCHRDGGAIREQTLLATFGKPTSTRTIQGSMFWQFSCKDGPIQLVVGDLHVRQYHGTLLVKHINDL